jgi:glucose-1-phosphate cytidylyltransferase
MRYCTHFGFNDFILCLGYKKEKIIEYFKDNQEFKIEFADTGLESSKGERLVQSRDYVNSDSDFVLINGDTLTNLNLSDFIEFHRQKQKIITLATAKLVSPFGILDLDNSEITGFIEKPVLNHWVNVGYYVVSRGIFDHVDHGEDLEADVFRKLGKKRKMCAFKHDGFWKDMETFKDCLDLNEMWEKNQAPWKIWE